jgi:transcriptional regulator with XRE-family HTH domain
VKVVNNRLAELIEIKARREGRKLTQRIIADEAGVALGSVSRWMQNRIDHYHTDAILAFCTFLDCEIGELLVIEESPEGEDTPEIKTPLSAVA